MLIRGVDKMFPLCLFFSVARSQLLAEFCPLGVWFLGREGPPMEFLLLAFRVSFLF